MTFQDVIRISLELSKTPTSQRLHPHLSISRHFGITWALNPGRFSPFLHKRLCQESRGKNKTTGLIWTRLFCILVRGDGAMATFISAKQHLRAKTTVSLLNRDKKTPRLCAQPCFFSEKISNQRQRQRTSCCLKNSSSHQLFKGRSVSLCLVPGGDLRWTKEIRRDEPHGQGVQVRRRAESSFFLDSPSQSGGPGCHSHVNESVKSHLLPPHAHQHAHTQSSVFAGTEYNKRSLEACREPSEERKLQHCYKVPNQLQARRRVGGGGSGG